MVFDTNEQKRHIFIGLYVIDPDFEFSSLRDYPIKKVIQRYQETSNCDNPCDMVPILQPKQ